MDIPDALKWGTVTGLFGAVASDSGDVERAPDVTMLNGTVTFTPSVQWVRVPDEGTYFLETVVAPLVDGVLCAPEEPTVPGVPLVATPQPGALPEMIQWTATFDFTGVVDSPAPVVFNIPAGGVVDLSTQMGAEEHAPYVVIVSTTEREAAQIAADAAEVSALQARSARVGAEAARDQVVEALAAGGGLLEEAASVVLADASVLRGTELSAVRALNVSDPLFSEVRLSQDFRRIGGTLREGGNVEASAGGAVAYVIPYGSGDVALTNDLRRAEPGSSPDGLTPYETLAGWAERMPVSSGFVSITMFGDSMSTDHGGLGLSQTVALATELGVAGHDCGISGDSPSQIAWRQGGLAWHATVTGDVVPGSGTAPVTIDPPTGHRGARSWPCEIVDATGVTRRVTLKHASTTPDASPAFTIEQASGDPFTVLAGSRITHLHTKDRGAQFSPTVLWCGRNDVNESRVVAAISGMLAAVRDRRTLVLPIFNRATEPSGSSGYLDVMAVNDAIATTAGIAFYDARSALIQHGLTVAGISPTPADTTAMSEDRVPPSLMSDDTHLNISGRLALARLIAIELRGRNW